MSVSPVGPAPQPLASRTARTAVTLMFGVNGLLLGGWGGSLPSLREKLAISDGSIALLLFSAGIAGITSMQICGRLAGSVGVRRIALASLPIMVLGIATLAVAPSLPVAVVGAILLGGGNGAMDVAMNAMGVQVETARRRPVMSSFHAFFSIGSLLGAASVLALAAGFRLAGGAIVTPLLLTLAAVAFVVLFVLLRIAPDAAPEARKHPEGGRIRIPRAAYVLGIMALAVGLSEGTAVDWSSIHVTDVAHVDPTTGAVGLVAVSAFMVVIRLLGDRLVTRFGRRAIIRFGGVSAALGFLAVTLVSSLPLLLAGWALVGLGVGMSAPQVYAVAGHLGGARVLAVVVTFGYAAFLTGPALIGGLVRHVGIHHAMAVPAVLCAVIVGLAVTVPREDRDLT